MKHKPFFEVTHTDGTARTGVLNLPKGPVETPVFMPVGTLGAMRGISHQKMEELGYRLILGNTYHLYLRPGLDLLKKAGGLRDFSTWPYNFLTDSGGFQFFSLAPFRKFTDEGVKFRSHIDGSYHFFSPESTIQAQEIIASDIYMALDQCTPPQLSEQKAYSATMATIAWAKRCQTQWLAGPQKGQLFGIVQGNFYHKLREICAQELAALDLPGYAIGGLSVGEEKSAFSDFIAFTAPLLPFEKPKYVMGIGTPDYILETIEHGVDMFDCVYPTRIARNGSAMTPHGLMVMKAERFTHDMRPIQEDCPCHACQRYSRAYIRHLVRTGEINALTLLTEHNLTFMAQFLENARDAIRQNRFLAFKKDFLAHYYA
ncbi:MAG: tRNA guanosine(34) transglycosylase Tgt [Spirochaetia bacterium]